VLVLDDLTEQRALEEQVQRAQRLSALGRLAGGLAHEIRNPLGITRAAAQMLHRELSEHARHGEYTEVIQTEIDRIDRLVEQLLSYARPLPLQRGSVDVEAVVERTVALTRAYARQQQILLHCDIEDQLPFIEGDGELLHQALVNLLLNGITATGQGGNVSIAAKAAAGESSRQVVMITVSDTGRGIAPADLPHIFDPFFTTRADGTGLGLSLVQQIIEEHGGTIEVDSQPGCGARFLLRIPALAHDAHITSDVPHGQSS
jgi:signal transduction histidine kinase